MVRRRNRGMRVPLVIAAAIVAVTAYIVLRAAGTGRRSGARPVPPPCPVAPTVAGIDVSYYQGDITWPRVRRAGVEFAFIRVSDGATITDSKFVANWRGARQAGVRRGAYQFFRPEENPIDQANVLVRALRAHGAGELPPVIDIEVTGGLPLPTVVARARVWIEHVRAQLGVEPIVYTNYGMWRGTGPNVERAGFTPARGVNELGRQTLWLAHYTERCPSVPPPWLRWAFWQYTEVGRVDGIDGLVDLNVFAGTVDDLPAFGR